MLCAWVCLGLEWTCQIVGVRLTKGEETVDRAMVCGYIDELSVDEGVVKKYEQCRAQHSEVYDQQVRVTRMKHDLEYENRDL
ncbi:hypothetical protein BGZ52_008997, partial [Haplosporangium bisporale]